MELHEADRNGTESRFAATGAGNSSPRTFSRRGRSLTAAAFFRWRFTLTGLERFPNMEQGRKRPEGRPGVGSATDAGPGKRSLRTARSSDRFSSSYAQQTDRVCLSPKRAYISPLFGWARYPTCPLRGGNVRSWMNAPSGTLWPTAFSIEQTNGAS